MTNLEKELFNPIFEFLTEKKEYFKLFNEIANNKKEFTKKSGAIQYKNEKWLQAELAIFLTKKGWVVGTEVERVDLCACQKSNPEERIFIEIKEYVNSGRDPKQPSVKEYDNRTTKDFVNINKISKKKSKKRNIGFSLILLPNGTKHDKNIKYSKYFYDKIKNYEIDGCKITEVYSRSINYNDETDEGFWVSWWSFNYNSTDYQELSNKYSKK